MFAVLSSLIDLVAAIVGGTFRLVGSCIGSCFGLVIAAMIVIALGLALLLHLV